ncbi:hypothetical protein L1887_37838 [Cichorium endivia]|nr:hypothetical protein L1887_37838 [Cichorium endivia]
MKCCYFFLLVCILSSCCIMEMKKEYGVVCEGYIDFLHFVFLGWLLLKHSDAVSNVLSIDRFICNKKLLGNPLDVQLSLTCWIWF